MTIAIVGLGYVGLPLSIQFARSGLTVIGLDIDPSKVEALNSGQSYIKHISKQDIADLLQTRRFLASSDFSRVAEVEAVIICVPTPLNKNREPDISYIIETGKAIAPYLRMGGTGVPPVPVGDPPTGTAAPFWKNSQHSTFNSQHSTANPQPLKMKL